MLGVRKAQRLKPRRRRCEFGFRINDRRGAGCVGGREEAPEEGLHCLLGEVGMALKF